MIIIFFRFKKIPHIPSKKRNVETTIYVTRSIKTDLLFIKEKRREWHLVVSSIFAGHFAFWKDDDEVRLSRPKGVLYSTPQI